MDKDEQDEFDEISRGLEEYLQHEENYCSYPDSLDIQDQGRKIIPDAALNNDGHSQKQASDHGTDDTGSAASRTVSGSGGTNNTGRTSARDSGSASGRRSSGSGSTDEAGSASSRAGSRSRNADSDTGSKSRKATPSGTSGRSAERDDETAEKKKARASHGGERYSDEEEELPPVKKTSKKRRRRRHPFRRLLVVLGVIVVVIAAAWYFITGSIYNEMNYEGILSVANESMRDEGVYNILLIGNDSRSDDEDGRSDAMILLSISPKTKTITMMSMLRDMYVDIPGYSNGNRLNAAYAYGGPELLMQTLEQNLGIEIHRYMLVNFEAFANLVDAVGGVTLELTNEEVSYVNGYLTEYNTLTNRPEGTDYLDPSLSGTIDLNGPQALAYCRIRYIGTDFARTERQRNVLTAVIRKLPSALISNPVGVITELFPSLTTNLTKSEFRQLSLQIFNLLTYDFSQCSIPISGSYTNATIRGMSVLDVDFETNKAFIRQTIYGE